MSLNQSNSYAHASRRGILVTGRKDKMYDVELTLFGKRNEFTIEGNSELYSFVKQLCEKVESGVSSELQQQQQQQRRQEEERQEEEGVYLEEVRFIHGGGVILLSERFEDVLNKLLDSEEVRVVLNGEVYGLDLGNRWNLEGNKFYKEKKYLDAIECYNIAIERYPNSYNSLCNRSLCYLFTERYLKCIEDVDNYFRHLGSIDIKMAEENVKKTIVKQWQRRASAHFKYASSLIKKQKKDDDLIENSQCSHNNNNNTGETKFTATTVMTMTKDGIMSNKKRKTFEKDLDRINDEVNDHPVDNSRLNHRHSEEEDDDDDIKNNKGEDDDDEEVLAENDNDVNIRKSQRIAKILEHLHLAMQDFLFIEASGIQNDTVLILDMVIPLYLHYQYVYKQQQQQQQQQLSSTGEVKIIVDLPFCLLCHRNYSSCGNSSGGNDNFNINNNQNNEAKSDDNHDKNDEEKLVVEQILIGNRLHHKVFCPSCYLRMQTLEKVYVEHIWNPLHVVSEENKQNSRTSTTGSLLIQKYDLSNLHAYILASAWKRLALSILPEENYNNEPFSASRALENLRVYLLSLLSSNISDGNSSTGIQGISIPVCYFIVSSSTAEKFINKSSSFVVDPSSTVFGFQFYHPDTTTTTTAAAAKDDLQDFHKQQLQVNERQIRKRIQFLHIQQKLIHFVIMLGPESLDQWGETFRLNFPLSKDFLLVPPDNQRVIPQPLMNYLK